MASKKTSAKNEVAVKAETGLALPFDFEMDVGAGLEGLDKDSFAIPFLRVIQSNSPQVEESNPAEYIKDAKPGMLFNSVTRQVYSGSEGVHFLPCAFQRRFIHWAPRGADGGFKGEYLPEEISEMRSNGTVVEVDGKLYVPDESGKVIDKKTDKMMDTRSHFGLVIGPDGDVSPALLALSSTQIKKSKHLMSILTGAKVDGENGKVTPPTWMNKVKLTTVPEKNAEGTWYGVKFEPDGCINSKDLYDMGKALHDSIAKGEHGADYAQADADPKSDQF